MAKGNGHRPAQRVDHRGDFVQMPHQVMRSAAWLDLSARARSALFVLLDSFTGFNNGKIGLTIDNLGAALGNQNHKANSRALAELIEHGFVECMTGANHVQSQAREYRLTFIESGDHSREKATNEWQSWVPKYGNTGPEISTTRKRKLVELTATRRKLSAEPTATRETETCGFEGGFHVEDTSAHIGSQYRPLVDDDSDRGNSFKSSPELRTALNALVAAGRASAADIAKAISMPTGTMSKFRHGRNLPEPYRGPLHWELGRRDAFASTEDPDAKSA